MQFSGIALFERDPQRNNKGPLALRKLGIASVHMCVRVAQPMTFKTLSLFLKLHILLI